MSKTGSRRNHDHGPVPRHPIMEVRTAEQSFALMAAMAAGENCYTPNYLNEI